MNANHNLSFSFFIQVDFVYYTGDIPSHNVWNQSREQQLYSLNTINHLLAKTFHNTTFYSAVGNHEAGRMSLVIRTYNYLIFLIT